jgi:hypothetical protein
MPSLSDKLVIAFYVVMIWNLLQMKGWCVVSLEADISKQFHPEQAYKFIYRM